MFNSIKIAFFARPDTERALEKFKNRARVVFLAQVGRRVLIY